MNIETMASYICKPSLEVIPHPEVELQLLKQVYYNHKVWKLSFYGSLCHGRKKLLDRYFQGVHLLFTWCGKYDRMQQQAWRGGAGTSLGPRPTRVPRSARGPGYEARLEPKFSLATALPQECNYGLTRARARLHNRQVQPPGRERGRLQPSQNRVVDTITAQTLNYAL